MMRCALPLRWGEQGLPAQPRRMLLVQLSAMGDQVQTLPAVSDIAARWPGLIIDWAVDARFAAIPGLHPAVHQVWALPLKAVQKAPFDTGLWRRLLSTLRALRRQDYDVVWDPHSVLKSSVVARLARSRLRVGYRAEDCGGEPRAARAYQLHFARPPGIHGTWGRRVFAQQVFETDLQRPIAYGLAETFGVEAPLQRDILFAHGVSREHREWPEAHWIELGRRLCAQGESVKLTWGNARERERAERISAALGDCARVLPPPADIPQLLHFIACSRLVVGVDTGFTHFAAALRRPQVAVFSRLTGPEVLLPEDPALARCVGGNGIDPDVAAVWAAVQDLLGAAPKL